MAVFKVLGSGCKSCNTTAELIEKAAVEQGLSIQVEKVSDPATIMNYGVMSTPAVVFNEQVIHAGGVPQASTISDWLSKV